MIKYIIGTSIVVILFSALCSGDVFRHRQSDEVFYGYPTNRSHGGKTRIYMLREGKFIGKTVVIDEYDITYDARGRKKNLYVIGIDNQDILLSDTVSNLLAKTIIEGANKGPVAIILEIDSPGGRGDYMQKVCDAIKKTSNCPVIAFISGKKYGGAFSAAAGVAIACDKVYIAPGAQIGTFAPQANTANLEGVADWQATFTPESIASMGGYLSTLAEIKNRPGAMAMALVDRNVEVVEVVTDEQGSRNIVHRAEKKPADAIVRTWSKMASLYSPNQQDEIAGPSASQITLSAEDAIYTKMADAILSSRSEVIEALDASDSKVINTSRIKVEVRKFAQSRALIHTYFNGITELQWQAEEIENELREVISQGRKNRPSREDERLKRLQREMYENQLSNQVIDRRILRTRIDQSRTRKSLSDEEIAQLEASIDDTYIDPYLFDEERLTEEFVYVLDDLITYYTRAEALASKYPGALPKGNTLRGVQQQLNSTLIKRDSLGY